MSRKTPLSHHAVAVVTGAGSGIGRSFAEALATRGSRILCVDINETAAEATAASLRSQGAIAKAYVCDVGNAEQMKTLADVCDDLLGAPVNLVINNAGVGVGGEIDETTLEDWQWCLQINLWGVIHGCHFFVPKLKKLGAGAIINVASAAGFGAAPAMSAYNVSKAGVLALTETLAAELHNTDIQMHVLCPTFVPTNIIDNGRMPSAMQSTAHDAMRRFSFTTSEDVAKLTLDRMDKGKLYTIPQIDAKLTWLAKRLMPQSYAQGMGVAYRWIPQ